MVGGSLRQIRGPGPRLVLLGIVIQAAAFILWSEQLLTASYVMGETLIDPLWVTGLLAIGAGGVLAGGRREAKAKRRRTDAVEQPLLRHLRGMLDISRAAASGRGPLPVLEAMAELMQTELYFQTVSVNLREGHEDDLRVVLVASDEEARGALLGNVNPWATWHPLLDPAHDRLGASWLPVGSYDWSDDPNTYTPEVRARAQPGRVGPRRRAAAPLARCHRRGARHGLRRRAADRAAPERRRRCAC